MLYSQDKISVQHFSKTVFLQADTSHHPRGCTPCCSAGRRSRAAGALPALTPQAAMPPPLPGAGTTRGPWFTLGCQGGVRPRGACARAARWGHCRGPGPQGCTSEQDPPARATALPTHGDPSCRGCSRALRLPSWVPPAPLTLQHPGCCPACAWGLLRAGLAAGPGHGPHRPPSWKTAASRHHSSAPGCSFPPEVLPDCFIELDIVRSVKVPELLYHLGVYLHVSPPFGLAQAAR